MREYKQGIARVMRSSRFRVCERLVFYQVYGQFVPNKLKRAICNFSGQSTVFLYLNLLQCIIIWIEKKHDLVSSGRPEDSSDRGPDTIS